VLVKDCPEFLKFCERFGEDAGDEVLTRICNAQWNGGKGKGIEFLDVHQHDVCNHTITGTIEHEGETFGFIIHNGNWNGTEVEAWGDPEDVGYYAPPKPTFYTYAPKKRREDMLSGLLQVYQLWTKEKWFQDKVRGYNYDRHFAPGGKTESYYRDWAETKGMRVVTMEEAAEYMKPIDFEAHNAAREARQTEIAELVKAWENMDETPR
jgi:hypothetical protein